MGAAEKQHECVTEGERLPVCCAARALGIKTGTLYNWHYKRKGPRRTWNRLRRRWEYDSRDLAKFEDAMREVQEAFR